MDFSSKLLENAVLEISQLPGIGKRTALRLALYLLKQPKGQDIPGSYSGELNIGQSQKHENTRP